MALTNTLYAGLSGLQVNETKLNVVGNNIANANTVAFKSTRVTFKPQFYVTDSGGSQPTDDFGGSNPAQRGLGAQVGSLERNFGPGAIETTGRPTDLAIDGAGFFIVQGEEQKFTRDGTFKLNPDNLMVTTAGDFVQGYGVDKNFNIVPGAIGNLTVPLGASTTAEATKKVTFQGNLDASGAVATGASVLNTQLLTTVDGTGAPTDSTLLTNISAASDVGNPLFADGDIYAFAGIKGGRELPEATFNVTTSTTLADLVTFYRQALGINTTVPDDGVSATPTPGVNISPNLDDPTTVRMQILGNLGDDNEITLQEGSFQTAGGKSPLTFSTVEPTIDLNSEAAGASVQTSLIAYDSLGTPINVAVTAILESTASTGNTWRFFAESGDDTDVDLVTGTGTLTFDASGKLIDSQGDTITIDRAATGASTPQNIKLDFSEVTQLTSKGSELVMTHQDGSAIGSLTGFSIGTEGKITGNFSNGVTRTLGQLAMATFTNAQGLIDRGGNMFVQGADSGTAVLGVPGTLGTGKVVSGALELSNVDLSQEFVNLIIASTGFAASSRVITTSDQLLTELLNSSR